MKSKSKTGYLTMARDSITNASAMIELEAKDNITNSEADNKLRQALKCLMQAQQALQGLGRRSSQYKT